MAPTFRAAYLIHGDDHGRIAERRARLCSLAESSSGSQGLERFDGDASTPEAVAAALSAMTFALGRRFIIVDGVERWREGDLGPLRSALETIAPETTVAFFAREEGRLKAPAGLHDAVRAAGGQVEAQQNIKPWELPRWVAGQASGLGLELEPDAARALIQHVGERQQRLRRELEKLVLEFGPGTKLTVEQIEELTAPSGERKLWALADAMVAGEAQTATQLYVTLRAQGERVPGIVYWMVQRVGQAVEVAERLERGEPPAQVKRGLRMPSRAADRLIADARRVGAEELRDAIQQLADLEYASRGGGPGGASEDAAVVRAIERIAG